MNSTRAAVRLASVLLATLTFAACSSAAGNLQVGMTPEQAISAMGRPESKDTVPDPKSGADVLRYSWPSQGKSAVFGPDNHVAQIENIEVVKSQGPSNFDPIGTPVEYFFYPVRLGIGWAASGLNCVLEGHCNPPTEIKSPGESGN